MTHEEMERIWKSAPDAPLSESVGVWSTDTKPNPFFHLWPRQQEIDHLMGHPGVDDQGDAVVVEPLALPPPAEEKKDQATAGSSEG